MSTVGPEARIQAKLKTWLVAHGAFVLKIHGGRMGHAGTPDLVCCWPALVGAHGYFLAFEVKQPGKKLTEIQAATLRSIQAAGGHARMVTSLDELIAALQEWGMFTPIPA